MHQQIIHLYQILSEIDSNPGKSMMFFTGGSYRQHLNNSLPALPNCRWNLLEEILNHLQAENDTFESADTVLGKIHLCYNVTQHLCWKSHEHHFHTDFKSYVNCPITCLTEIIEYLDKMLKEIYVI